MTDFLIGLAVIPAIAAAVTAIVATRWFVIHRIQRLKSANPHRRAALAARMFASRRAYVWWTRRVAVSVSLGVDWPQRDQAEAVLLDEFVGAQGAGPAGEVYQ